MKLKDKTILIISNEPWGNIWYSKHNWANELSKNNLVYFINPPRRWQILDLFLSKINIEDYSDTLKILSYNNRLPFTRFNLLFKLNENLISRSFNKYFAKKKNIIFWTFDPYRLIYPKKLNILTSVYFIADRYLTKRERILIKNVENVISVSKELTENINNKRVLNLSHGISETEFKVDGINKEDYILYIGGIDHRLDYKLIERLLIEFPEQIFLFIGKKSIVKDEAFKNIFIDKKYPNFKYQLPIHFKELKKYIAKAKLCLAPMRLDVQGNSINHHKLLQYLALGKPVLSARFTDYKENELLIQFSTEQDAIIKLKYFLYNGESAELADKRINFTKQFLYFNLIKKIEDFL